MDRCITICGFPESGKTTYLAALWHLVTARADQTHLRFASLRNGDASHLNALAARWRDGKTQARTDVNSNQLVSMNLLNVSSIPLRLTFPDLSGESYRAMFEDRDCSPPLAEILRRGDGMLFFVHADRIRQPHSVVDVVAQSNALGSPVVSREVVPWSPTLVPTQVQIVDLLQLLCLPPLEVPHRRMAVILSAWDKVADEARTPDEYVAQQLPLLDQYLRSAADGWTWHVYGVSAQGGDYEKENQQLSAPQFARLQQLRALDEASMRIRVISGTSESRDLTEPIEWLMA